MEMLRQRGAELSYSDPFVGELSLGTLSLRSQEPTPALLRKMAAVVLITDHTAFDCAKLVSSSRLFVDTRNATGRAGVKAPGKIVKL